MGSSQRKLPRQTSRKLPLFPDQERYFSVNNGYSDNQLDLGYGPAATQINALSVGSGYYTVAITVVPADVAANTPATYAIIATSAGPQVKDTDCSKFQAVETGATSSTNSAGTDSTAMCWTIPPPCAGRFHRHVLEMTARTGRRRVGQSASMSSSTRLSFSIRSGQKRR
jgi:Tfp pilus assembly protein PilE